MSIISFFFGLCLGQRLFTITDNLSKTSQNAVSSQKCAELTLKTFKSIRNTENIELFQCPGKGWYFLLMVQNWSRKRTNETPSFNSLVSSWARNCQRGVSTNKIWCFRLHHIRYSWEVWPIKFNYSKPEQLLLHAIQGETYTGGTVQFWSIRTSAYSCCEFQFVVLL